MRGPLAATIYAVGAAVLFSAPLAAASPTPIAPGAKAPVWKDLPGVDGQKHSLADLEDAKVVVVAFTCNTCPYSVAYEDRLIAFTKKYAPKGVAVVAINVNTHEGEDLATMKQRADEKNFPFPYVHDPSQQVGRDYGAKVTPHIFVLDSDRKVAYVGAFDNKKDPKRVTRRYVEQAVDALLAGATPEVRETRAAGCSIRYE